jgi:GntR family transcriptional regulator
MKYTTSTNHSEVTRRSGIAYYRQVYTVIARALAEGDIAPGSALPSETEMMARFSVSRNTVRRALAQLEREKRIVRRRGSGSFARSVPQAESSLESIVGTVHQDGYAKARTASRLLQIQMDLTPEFVRRRDPQFGERSLVVKRTRSFKSLPFLLITSHVPEYLAGRLTRRQLARDTVLVALDTLGVKAFSAEQITTAVAADSFTAHHLDVEPATALLCVYRVIRDGDGRSIEHQSLLHRPDRFELRTNALIEQSRSGLEWSSAQSPNVPAWL